MHTVCVPLICSNNWAVLPLAQCMTKPTESKKLFLASVWSTVRVFFLNLMCNTFSTFCFHFEELTNKKYVCNPEWPALMRVGFFLNGHKKISKRSSATFKMRKVLFLCNFLNPLVFLTQLMYWAIFLAVNCITFCNAPLVTFFFASCLCYLLIWTTKTVR